MPKNIFLISILVVFLLSSCSHQPIIPEVKLTTSTVTVTPTCQGCSTDPICAVADDIIINETTIYSTCIPQPAGQGTFISHTGNCYIWTPSSSQTEIVTTCIIVCTGKICDTTLVTIFPPLPSDTTFTGIKCNADTVYFEKEILPIITANCAYSGCHNTVTAADGIKLDNYANIIKYGKIKPFNVSKSELYEVITDTDQKDVMPPPPAAKLSVAQIALISKWIGQGAKNNTCNDQPGGCSTDNVSFSTYVKPALASCTTCHKTGNAGGGINLDSYAGFKSAAISGKLYGALSWSNGFMAMPQGGSKLPDCNINKIKSWIDAGAANN